MKAEALLPRRPGIFFVRLRIQQSCVDDLWALCIDTVQRGGLPAGDLAEPGNADSCQHVISPYWWQCGQQPAGGEIRCHQTEHSGVVGEPIHIRNTIPTRLQRERQIGQYFV
jgi:hypothetical protein